MCTRILVHLERIRRQPSAVTALRVRVRMRVTVKVRVRVRVETAAHLCPTRVRASQRVPVGAMEATWALGS
eukprot:COSAG01_NODE_51424_length_355_cov_0.578125_1_plen_70_part_10